MFLVTCPIIFPSLDRFQFECSNGNHEGSECRFFCAEDQTLIGPTNIRCESNGNWNNDPNRIMCVDTEGKANKLLVALIKNYAISNL